ncbi:MAG: hypothetical protein OEN50_05290, partial [Deltaproteobacteria bacterium]|nr:hypothetical protein [Deltaproteobacteria bacterium]
MFRVKMSLFAVAIFLSLLAGLTNSCGPTVLPQRPPEGYQGLVVEGPIVGMDDYWIYQRPDGSRVKLGAGNPLYRIEFPLWVGKIWRFSSTATSILNRPAGTASIPVEIECFAASLESITIKAGNFDAFECRCECMIAGATGGFERFCGKRTFWYAPRA